MTSTRDVCQPGLKWENNLFGTKPTWTAEPSIAVIKKLVQEALGAESDVAFLAQGAFNKIYSVNCCVGDFVLRVALPVAPKVKTLSEVATIAFIRSRTNLPIPRVLAYNADFNNKLGFEWLLMDRVHGRSLRSCWNEISWLKKGLLVQKMAEFVSEMFHIKLSSIGSLYEYHLNSHPDSNDAAVEHALGEVVSPTFFVGSHIRQIFHRGPYRTSAEYVLAHMQLLLQDIQSWRISDNEDDRDQAEEAQIIYEKLQLIIPKLFLDVGLETTSVLHQDLSSNNILVDDKGDLVGIIDWECAVAAPHWQACRVPQFLDYGKQENCAPEPLTENEQKDEDVVEYHHALVHDYEVTQLNRFFLEEMERLNPQWVQIHNEGTTCREIMVALEFTSSGMYAHQVEGWLDCLLEGKKPRLTLSESIFDPYKYDA
ncbi:phosphotransferase enzyme family-domain-containing protein [Boeremia exigua]|uniref:phosphotransferase enzyme family-domain-containing protein n=1 Tax=Boeremia exigua TaxID=749465 RepID=UPI001E8DB069|nr:phosphotransferase enzyme family-domain-containing protein [Boeremia exigua]KAH6615305.1 phosphotransferase enzyme family-domain-containing protein [Boeremia exigua]